MAAHVTADDVQRGWTTSLDAEVIEGMIVDAYEEVYAYLEEHGITDPETLYEGADALPLSVRRAIIDATRCTISTMDLSGGGRARSVQEATEKITYATTKDGPATDPCSWRERLRAWARKASPGTKPMIGAVTKRVGHTIVDGGQVNSDVIVPPPEDT